MTEEIERCQGVDRCFGTRFLSRCRPIVFSMEPMMMRIMVVTEQPPEIREGKTDLKEAFDNAPKNTVPRRLEELLGREFSQSVKDEKGPYYWTHYIKCPGRYRDVSGIEGGRCADTWLWEEVESLRPLLILCIGSETSKWLFEQVPRRFTLVGVDNEKLKEYKQDWQEYLWREISEQYTAKLRIDNNAEAILVCLYHPSERSGIGWSIDRKLKPLIQRSLGEVWNAIR